MTVAVAVLGGAALAAWLGVFLHPARPWDLRPRDHDLRGDDPDPWPELCVIVPAHDESLVLPQTLPALLGQDYPGDWRVVLVDDRSVDGTGDVARGLQSDRLEVVTGAPLPEGWVGKVWALEQGLGHAGDAKLVLLTDADIVHAPGNLRRLVAELEGAGLALDSRMAALHVGGPVERLLVPPFIFFFALLFPMRWVNDTRRKFAAAAGGCIVVRADALRAIGGFASVRGAVIDDIALARAVKRAGLPIRLAVSTGAVRSVRAYGTIGAFWRTVRRTAFTQLRRSWLLLALTTAALLVTFVAPLALVLLGALDADERWALALGGGAWLALSVAYLPTVRLYGLFAAWALTLPVAGVLYGAMTVDSALRHERGAW